MYQEITDWLALQSSLGRTEKTISNYQGRLRYFRRYAHEKECKQVRSITVNLLRAYHDSLIKKQMKVNSIHSYLTTIQTWLKWLYDNGKLMSDLSLKITLPKLEETLPPIAPCPVVLKKLFEAMPVTTEVGKRNKSVLVLSYSAGLRLNEAISLNIGSLDIDEKILTVAGKGLHQRQVPVCQYAVDVIFEYLKARGGKPKSKSPLFTLEDCNKRITEGTINAILRKVKDAGGMRLNFHLLRHCFAIHLLQGGADLRYVQSLLGHSSPDITSRYLGIVRTQLKQDYEKAMSVLFNHYN